jgi:hypothetical protein
VVQVVKEADGEIVYTLRIRGNTFRPRVFESGRYEVRVGDPDRGLMKTLPDLLAGAAEAAGTIEVRF